MNSFLDIKGNKICFEVVSVNCSLCKSQSFHLDDLIEDDFALMQYFNDGDKEDIEEFYNDKIIHDLIIIPENEVLKEYIGKQLNLKCIQR